MFPVWKEDKNLRLLNQCLVFLFDSPRQIHLKRIVTKEVSNGQQKENNDDQKQQLFNNLAAAMAGVPANIVERQLGHFHKADPAYAVGVANALGITWKAAAWY